MTYGAGFKASARKLDAGRAGSAGRARPPGAACRGARLRAPGDGQAPQRFDEAPAAAPTWRDACCAALARRPRCAHDALVESAAIVRDCRADLPLLERSSVSVDLACRGIGRARATGADGTSRPRLASRLGDRLVIRCQASAGTCTIGRAAPAIVDQLSREGALLGEHHQRGCC